MSIHYILKDKKPVATDAITWAKWFAEADRVVAKTQIGEVGISTVFLGLDHQYGSGPPLLFETMIFGGPFDGETYRCSSWAEAEVIHKDMEKKINDN